MSNFLSFSGRLTKAPTLQTKAGRGGQPDIKYVNFQLIRNEFTGYEADGKTPRAERIVAPYFTMFGARAEAFCKNAMEGDQIILEARITTDEYTGSNNQTTYSTSLIADSYEFGAPGRRKREYLNSLPPDQRKNSAHTAAPIPPDEDLY